MRRETIKNCIDKRVCIIIRLITQLLEYKPSDKRMNLKGGTLTTYEESALNGVSNVSVLVFGEQVPEDIGIAISAKCQNEECSPQICGGHCEEVVGQELEKLVWREELRRAVRSGSPRGETNGAGHPRA